MLLLPTTFSAGLKHENRMGTTNAEVYNNDDIRMSSQLNKKYYMDTTLVSSQMPSLLAFKRRLIHTRETSLPRSQSRPAASVPAKPQTGLRRPRLNRTVLVPAQFPRTAVNFCPRVELCNSGLKTRTAKVSPGPNDRRRHNLTVDIPSTGVGCKVPRLFLSFAQPCSSLVSPSQDRVKQKYVRRIDRKFWKIFEEQRGKRSRRTESCFQRPVDMENISSSNNNNNAEDIDRLTPRQIRYSDLGSKIVHGQDRRREIWRPRTGGAGGKSTVWGGRRGRRAGMCRC